MRNPTVHPPNGGDVDNDFYVRRRARVHAARRRWWIRTAVKLALWLVGAYTVRLLDKENFKMYLIISILAFIYFSVVHSEDQHDEQVSTTIVASPKPRRQPVTGKAREGAHGQRADLPTVSAGPSRPEVSLLHDAALPPQQQLKLLLSMRAIGTAPAMRCVTDAAFRKTVQSCDASPLDPCLCGSRHPFGRCCLQVQEELKTIFS